MVRLLYSTQHCNHQYILLGIEYQIKSTLFLISIWHLGLLNPDLASSTQKDGTPSLIPSIPSSKSSN